MENVIINATVRTDTGKKVAKDLRIKGLVPANVYKAGKDALSLQFTLKEFNEALRTKAGENVIITLKLQGDAKEKEKNVVIKEIQRGPIKGEVLHVDLHEISLTEAIKVDVRLVSRGEPEGVKKDKGILEHIMWELHIECLPTAIPEKIEVDVSALKIGDAVHVKDIVPPAGVKITNDPELITMIVKPPKVEAAKEAAEEASSAEPELIRKKKEEEPGAAGEAEAPKAAQTK